MWECDPLLSFYTFLDIFFFLASGDHGCILTALHAVSACSNKKQLAHCSCNFWLLCCIWKNVLAIISGHCLAVGPVCLQIPATVLHFDQYTDNFYLMQCLLCNFFVVMFGSSPCTKGYAFSCMCKGHWNCTALLFGSLVMSILGQGPLCNKVALDVCVSVLVWMTNIVEMLVATYSL